MANKMHTKSPVRDPKWTDDQWAGISTTGCGILVSAAAGSGKTAVLAERCAYLVCDAPHTCEVDELLVVTFTEAAAAEMKARIAAALRKRLAADQSPRLARQVALVEHATITTLHGFCARVLRQHFQVLGLDPGFSVIDADEADLLRSETARRLFDERYESAGPDSPFRALVDHYGDGDDHRLIARVIRTHEMLGSLVDPDAWQAMARQRIAEAAEKPLSESALGREHAALVERRLNAMRTQCAAAGSRITANPELVKYADHLRELYTILNAWSKTLRDSGIDALAALVRDFKPPRLPTIRGDVPGKEQAKSAIDAVKDAMKAGPLRDLLLFSESEWRAGLAETLPYLDEFLSLVHEFSERYAHEKRLIRGLDFTDLERMALEALRDRAGHPALAPSAVARLYHKQFRHVLVDEYQDINEVQDAILSLVSHECLCMVDSGIPSNLFCVGDVKQSIYRFRLAEPTRFLARQGLFRDPAGSAGRLIDLQANFRSRGPLLDAINRTFQPLMIGDSTEILYDASHELRTGSPYPVSDDQTTFAGSPIELHLLPKEAVTHVAVSDDDDADLDRTDYEATFVARRIRELMGLDGRPPMQVTEKSGADFVTRPIRFTDIVILLRSLKFKADQFARILRQHDIPAHTDAGTGFFDSMEIRDLLSLLSILDNQQQDIPLAAVLRSPLAGIAQPEDALARIRLAYSDRDNPTPFHQAVVRYAREHDDELAARLREFLSQLTQWRDLAHKRPLAELLWTIYDTSGYMAFCAGMEQGQQRVANLIQLHERARQFGSFRRQGLFRFLKFLQNLAEQKDLSQSPLPDEAGDAVRIMSIHASKGLEFPVVFLPDLGKRHNLQDTRGAILADRAAYLGFSVVDPVRQVRFPSLAHVLVQNRLREQTLAEELRLLYVAMTRAKEHLILVGTAPETACESWRNEWSDHTGPLPLETVMAATATLDWIGPVTVLRSAASCFETHCHSLDEVKSWTTQDLRRPTLNALQAHMRDLHPLNPAPPADPVAEAVVQRLAFQYPHTRFAQLQAAVSVTQWTKHGKPVPLSHSDLRPQTTQGATLSPPKCVQTVQAPSAIDRGNATHLILRYLDFRRPCTDTDLAAQVDTLVEKRLITPAHAGAADLPGIEWIAQSVIGQLLRDPAHQVYRELPFYLAVAPGQIDPTAASSDPADQIMLRGQIDALVLSPTEITLIDFKTDRITEADVPSRAEFYAGQVTQYAVAIQKILSRPVTQTLLVFLTPRQIWRSPRT